ncbi:MAG: hypothetical protein KAS32_30460 [Candidatus Peribacteraceae bacterium]|nr:hypothetical protein [Candidatus Peribacteraceae bacterium]
MLLGIKIKIDNDDITIEKLEAFDRLLSEEVIPEILSVIGTDVLAAAVDNLSGPSKGVRTIKTKSGAQRTEPINPGLAGDYPVPLYSGHLRRSMDIVLPGMSKAAGGDTFTAGENEVVIFNSAEYAGVIHEGGGSSEKYGRRAFLEDAINDYVGDGKSQAVVDNKVGEALRSIGLE